MANSYIVGDASSAVDAMREKKDVLNFMRDDDILRKYSLCLLLQAQQHRKVILANNKRQNDSNVKLDDLRDQGCVRPRTLVLLPFRENAYQFVNTLISVFESSLRTGKSLAVSFKRRFKREFGPAQGEGPEKARGVKPADYEAVFAGNVDDHFALGIALAKRTVKLFTPFEESDIIVASPIRMSRLINEWAVRQKEGEADDDVEMSDLEDQDAEVMEMMGAEGEKKEGPVSRCDPQTLLSSIELLVVDHADVLYMQNWMHVMTVMEQLNRAPQRMLREANYFRCRQCFLDGEGALIRQSLVFARHFVHAVRHHLAPHLRNLAGRVEVMPRVDAAPELWPGLAGVAVERHRVSAGSTGIEPRLNTFRRAVLPGLRRSAEGGVLVYAGTPADRLRLVRCLHVEEQLDIGFLHEEMTPEKQQSVRHRFQLGRVRILVLSERLHFYRRWRLRGVRSLIFYRPPALAHLLPELCAMAERQAGAEVRCQVLVDPRDPQDVFVFCRLFGEEKTRTVMA